MLKKVKNLNLLVVFLIIICFFILISSINFIQNEENYLELTLNLKQTYAEKKATADKYMDEINDYVSEVNDKGYPDPIINKLYENATLSYQSLDYEVLEELADLIKIRRDKVLEMNTFIEKVNKNIERFENNERLNTSIYISSLKKIDLLLIKRSYDEAYDLCLDIETDLEIIVLDYIIKAEMLFNELEENNFTTVYIKDLLIGTKDAFSGAKTEELIIKLNYENNSFKKNYWIGFIKDIENMDFRADFVDYNTILQNTEEISYRKNQLFDIIGRINSLEVKIQNYSNQGVNVDEVIVLFNESLIAFLEENFDKADSLLVEVNSKLEAEKVKLTVTSVIARESLGFLKRYWKRIIIISLVIIILGYILYKKEKVLILKRKLKNLIIEEGVLIELIKETQQSKFIEQKLSDSVYGIKMEKYNERLNRIKEDIGTINSLLYKLTKKKKKKKKSKLKNKKVKIKKKIKKGNKKNLNKKESKKSLNIKKRKVKKRK